MKSSQVLKFRFDVFNALTSKYIPCNKSTLHTQSVDYCYKYKGQRVRWPSHVLRQLWNTKTLFHTSYFILIASLPKVDQKTLPRFEISPFLHVLYITVVCKSKFFKGCFHCNQSLHVNLPMKASKRNFLCDSQPITRICSPLI